MKKCILLFSLLSGSLITQATQFTVNISGFAYNPFVQTSQTDWNNNNPNPLAGGLGVRTSNFQIIITNTNTIYYGCQAHMSGGMKGVINVVFTPVNDIQLKDLSYKMMPNPVRDHGMFNLKLKKSETVSLTMFDMNGRLVQRIVDKKLLPAGDYNFHVHASDLSNGTYIMWLRTGEGAVPKRFMVVRE
jgi:Secretion system C-terminal sorting domain